MTTIADLVLARADDHRPGLLYDDRSWTWAEYVQACADRAALALSLRRDGPFHIGVLLDNGPEFSMWLGGAALSGAAVVGINPTRRGEELARDVRHTECQLLVTDTGYLPLLDGLDTGVAGDRVLVVDRGLPLPDRAELPGVAVDEATLFLLLFTSGTSGAPKACLCSHGRLAAAGRGLSMGLPLTADDVCYLVMPLFHSNALMAGWAPALAAGATMALRPNFSASGFLPDVRRFGVTYFNYVGKPLSYILATPEAPDDADNSLRVAFGNEAAELDIERFARRFGCRVFDAYGSTEGAVVVRRVPDMPPGALGVGPEGTVVLHPDTGEECPRARFDADGRLLNPTEAVGELANRLGGAGFEGYWRNDDANRARVRDGVYWSGDLAYRDEQGFLYFAGRDVDWLRVDGENFAAAPVERILARHPDVTLAVVYPVPAPDVGDEAMAALQLRPGATFDPVAFRAFLDAQPDLGTKMSPRLVRIAEQLPVTETNKVLKRQLRSERWDCDDPVWWHPRREPGYRLLTDDDRAALAGRHDALAR